MFKFVDKIPQIQDNTIKMVTVSNAIKSKEELLHFFTESLQFPYTTVTNYDAFRDVMEELEWLAEEEIIIYHESLPSLNSKLLSVYLDVLNLIDVEWKLYEMRAEIIKKYIRSRGEVVPSDSWLTQKPKIFNVYFRLEDRKYVEALLKRYSRDYRKCIHYDESGCESIDEEQPSTRGSFISNLGNIWIIQKKDVYLHAKNLIEICKKWL